MMGMKMKRNLLIAVIIPWIFVLTAVAAPTQAIPGRTVLIAQATQDGCYLLTIDAYCTNMNVCPSISSSQPFVSVLTPEQYAFFMNKSNTLAFYGGGEDGPQYVYNQVLQALTEKNNSLPTNEKFDPTIVAQQGITLLGVRGSVQSPSSEQNKTTVFYSNPTGYQTHTLQPPLTPVDPFAVSCGTEISNM